MNMGVGFARVRTKGIRISNVLLYKKSLVYVTEFAKICLIAGERNCSYSAFLPGKSLNMSIFFLVQKSNL